MRSVTTADFKQNTLVHVQESVSLHRNLLDSAGLTQNFRQAEEEKLVGLQVLLCWSFTLCLLALDYTFLLSKRKTDYIH